MARTRFTLILYFRRVAHKGACHTLSKAFFEINEDMVQTDDVKSTLNQWCFTIMTLINFEIMSVQRGVPSVHLSKPDRLAHNMQYNLLFSSLCVCPFFPKGLRN